MGNKSGFGTVLLITIFTLLVMAGGIGWHVYSTNPARTNTIRTDAPSPLSESQSSTQGYLIIHEWGIRLSAQDNAKGMSYTISKEQEWAYLSTPRLTELSKLYAECEGADTSVTIARAKPGDNHLGSPWQQAELEKVGKKIGEYYYYGNVGQPCFPESNDFTVPEEIKKIRAALDKAITSVQASN